MVLTAWEAGVGSNWVGFFGLEAVNPLLGIPENLDVLAIVPFGYPVQVVGKGRKKRKPFSQIVSKERFGQPFTST
jgi:nitroreductase